MHAQHAGWAILTDVAYSEAGSVDPGGSAIGQRRIGFTRARWPRMCGSSDSPFPKTRRTASSMPDSLASHLLGTSAEDCKTLIRGLESLQVHHPDLLSY